MDKSGSTRGNKQDEHFPMDPCRNQVPEVALTIPRHYNISVSLLFDYSLRVPSQMKLICFILLYWLVIAIPDISVENSEISRWKGKVLTIKKTILL